MGDDRRDSDVSECGFKLERLFEVEEFSVPELHLSNNHELEEQKVSSDLYHFKPLNTQLHAATLNLNGCWWEGHSKRLVQAMCYVGLTVLCVIKGLAHW